MRRLRPLSVLLLGLLLLVRARAPAVPGAGPPAPAGTLPSSPEAADDRGAEGPGDAFEIASPNFVPVTDMLARLDRLLETSQATTQAIQDALLRIAEDPVPREIEGSGLRDRSWRHRTSRQVVGLPPVLATSKTIEQALPTACEDTATKPLPPAVMVATPERNGAAR